MTHEPRATDRDHDLDPVRAPILAIDRVHADGATWQRDSDEGSLNTDFKFIRATPHIRVRSAIRPDAGQRHVA
jgi:hypothetical protein